MSRHRHKHEPKPREPLLLWWMPFVALVSPLLFAAWTAASVDSDAVVSALESLLWPGVALYGVTLAVLWGGWKIELE